MQISPGQRIPLSNIGIGPRLHLNVDIQSGLTVDIACFGLDAQGKLSDDRYMTFFNQTRTPCGAVELAGNGRFSINLDLLPASIEKLVFTAAIDGAGAMKELASSKLTISTPEGTVAATCPFSGSNFSAEKAIMVADLYRKDGSWRLAANLQGFNEGLSALVRHFGGEVAAPAAGSPPPRVSLEKKVAAAATATPQLISLAKKAQISLEKAKLTDTKARVALVLDASGSMNKQYEKGIVQEVVDRLLPLAIHFDDDGSIDCWAFADKPCQLSGVSLSNYKDFIGKDSGGWKRWNVGPRVNDEPAVMRDVIKHYSSSSDKTPVYVLFISDGGVHKNREITQLVTEAAKLPIFWQFVGIGGYDYGILSKLDNMTGRVVDNCSFFALDKLSDVSEQQLYDMLMEEFPEWLKAAAAKSIIA